MATGLLIRDFFKQYREARYSGRGSLTVSGIEHNAYRLSLTLEITHLDSPRYGNLKTLPENTHYGYVTLFRGSTVTETIPVKYPKVRIFDIINQGIWNYHQQTESLQLGAGVSVSSSNAASSGILGKLGDLVSGTVCFLVGLETASSGGGPGSDFVLDFFDCSEPDSESRDITKKYRGFPVATPFPDIAKFKGDVPMSFLWRLEQWYLVNPAVYITDNPTDASDETDGEDEYPIPEQGDGDGDGDEFPQSDEPDPSSDPRDFSSGDILGRVGLWRTAIRFFNPGSNPACDAVPNGTISLNGYANEVPSFVPDGTTNPTGGVPGSWQTSIDSSKISGDCGVAVTGLGWVFFPGESVP